MYYVTPVEFMRGNCRCPFCRKHSISDSYKQDATILKNKIISILGENYLILNLEFRKNIKYHAYYVTIKHKTCGREYTTRIDHIISDKRKCRCTKKLKSKGEMLILESLDILNIKYEHPKIFSDLYDKMPLHYDFYLNEYNVLIEYQGIQHYDSNHQLSNRKGAWELQKKHDEMKRKYARYKDIRLIEIPFTVNNKDNIDKIIKNIYI